MKSITLHMKYRGHKSNVKPHVLEQFSGSIKSMDEANKIPPMYSNKCTKRLTNLTLDPLKLQSHLHSKFYGKFGNCWQSLVMHFFSASFRNSDHITAAGGKGKLRLKAASIRMGWENVTGMRPSIHPQQRGAPPSFLQYLAGATHRATVYLCQSNQSQRRQERKRDWAGRDNAGQNLVHNTNNM